MFFLFSFIKNMFSCVLSHPFLINISFFRMEKFPIFLFCFSCYYYLSIFIFVLIINVINVKINFIYFLFLIFIPMRFCDGFFVSSTTTSEYWRKFNEFHKFAINIRLSPQIQIKLIEIVYVAIDNAIRRFLMPLISCVIQLIWFSS